MRILLAGLTYLSILAIIPLTAAGQIDQERADSYFEEAGTLCEREGGRLWGESLCGAMVFADPVTGTIATNQQPPDAPKPRVLGYANAALEWGEERWSTFVWQMIPAEDARARGRLMLHELFHRVQPDLGLHIPSTKAAPDHLDTQEGRYWIQLEWRALASALGSSSSERTEALRDALSFRRYRRSMFEDAAESERVIEINEGLAQYTATVAVASSSDTAASDAIDQLGQAPEKESFVRTFAYPSGAAYGILLDDLSAGWTRRIKADDDLGDLLESAAGIQPTVNHRAAALRYGGRQLWAAEEDREVNRQARIAELQRRFVEGPVLLIPRGRNASFVTTGVTVLPDAGTVYPSFRVAGEWGSIEAEHVLVSSDGNVIAVPLPATIEDASISGEGWVVNMASGWIVRPGSREGDLQLVPEDPGAPSSRQ